MAMCFFCSSFSLYKKYSPTSFACCCSFPSSSTSITARTAAQAVALPPYYRKRVSSLKNRTSNPSLSKMDRAETTHRVEVFNASFGEGLCNLWRRHQSSYGEPVGYCSSVSGHQCLCPHTTNSMTIIKSNSPIADALSDRHEIRYNFLFLEGPKMVSHTAESRLDFVGKTKSSGGSHGSATNNSFTG